MLKSFYCVTFCKTIDVWSKTSISIIFVCFLLDSKFELFITDARRLVLTKRVVCPFLPLGGDLSFYSVR